MKINETLIEPCYLVGDNQNNDCLNTIFGTAKVNNKGYFQLTTHYKDNHRRLLHRIIVEHFYQITLPSNWSVHHINRNKKDNRIINLAIMPCKKHHRLHSDEQIGTSLSLSSKLKLSLKNNTTGYFRVSIKKDNTTKQGFVYRYRYFENGKRKEIESVDLKRLEQKVKNKGLEWCKV